MATPRELMHQDHYKAARAAADPRDIAELGEPDGYYLSMDKPRAYWRPAGVPAFEGATHEGSDALDLDSMPDDAEPDVDATARIRIPDDEVPF